MECLRKASDKKRICPMLKEVDDLVCLMTNFMVEDERVKVEAASINLADIIHKLWVWFLVQSGIGMLTNVLKMICTYTNGCDLGRLVYINNILKTNIKDNFFVVEVKHFLISGLRL